MSLDLVFMGPGNERVRVLGTQDAPLFVAKDVCAALALTNPSEALSNFDEDEKGIGTTDPLREWSPDLRTGGPQQVLVVTEAGLYRLIFQSRKPEATVFRRWVTHEVLPAIRKTGQYAAHPDGNRAARPAVSRDELLSDIALAERILFQQPVKLSDLELLKDGVRKLLRQRGFVVRHGFDRYDQPSIKAELLNQHFGHTTVRVLDAIKDHPSSSQGQLQAIVRCNHQALIYALASLRDRGLITRVVGPRRANLWTAVPTEQAGGER